jgi:hypothetical protein
VNELGLQFIESYEQPFQHEKITMQPSDYELQIKKEEEDEIARAQKERAGVSSSGSESGGSQKGNKMLNAI